MKSNFIENYIQKTSGIFSMFSSVEEAEKMKTIAENLQEKNKLYNLTAITDEDEILNKHIIDSLFVAHYIKQLDCSGKNLLDVGSGAGFPALPIAVVLNKLMVTALDSTEKKCTFIKQTAALSGLTNVDVIYGRAEEQTRKYESFDFVTARAVARLNILLELCVSFIKSGGYFLAMKGPAGEKEKKEAENAAEVLGVEIIDNIAYKLPDHNDMRNLIIYKKIRSTPDIYPRKFSIISKKPL